MGHWALDQASAMTIPVLWPEPYRKWVRWTEEKKHQHGAVNLKELEWFWMKEWSLISCQVFFNLIRHYRRTFWAVKLANRGFKKYDIWRKEHESMDPSCLVSTVQAGDGGVMVWGIFSWHALGPLVPIEHRLNATTYPSIVADHVHLFMTTVYPSSDG